MDSIIQKLNARIDRHSDACLRETQCACKAIRWKLYSKNKDDIAYFIAWKSETLYEQAKHDANYFYKGKAC